MEKSESIATIAGALMGFQKDMVAVKKTSENPFFKSKYADLAEIWDAIRESLVKHGLSVAQMPQFSDGQPVLSTLLMHTSGEWLCSNLVIVAAKQADPQALGSAITYSRRYSLSAMLGVVSEEDDDAESAMKRPKTESKSNEERKAPGHWCSKHKTPFFKKGNMKGYAHPIKDDEGNPTGEWCNEDQPEPVYPALEANIDWDWLKESLVTLGKKDPGQWSNSAVVTMLNENSDSQSKSVKEAVANLPADEQKNFVDMIQRELAAV